MRTLCTVCSGACACATCTYAVRYVNRTCCARSTGRPRRRRLRLSGDVVGRGRPVKRAYTQRPGATPTTRRPDPRHWAPRWHTSFHPRLAFSGGGGTLCRSRAHISIPPQRMYIGGRAAATVRHMRACPPAGHSTSSL